MSLTTSRANYREILYIFLKIYLPFFFCEKKLKSFKCTKKKIQMLLRRLNRNNLFLLPSSYLSESGLFKFSLTNPSQIWPNSRVSHFFCNDKWNEKRGKNDSFSLCNCHNNVQPHSFFALCASGTFRRGLSKKVSKHVLLRERFITYEWIRSSLDASMLVALRHI